uniref:Uncharacterized protein n=1 Tax=Arundo donax TaxID=35708 RepID=A0A0A8Y5U3_ARUDO
MSLWSQEVLRALRSQACSFEADPASVLTQLIERGLQDVFWLDI